MSMPLLSRLLLLPLLIVALEVVLAMVPNLYACDASDAKKLMMHNTTGTDRQIDRQTNRYINRQIDRYTDTKVDRWIEQRIAAELRTR